MIYLTITQLNITQISITQLNINQLNINQLKMTQQVCTIVPSKIKLRPLYKIVFEKYLVTIQIQHFTFPLSGTNIQLGQVSQVGQAG